MCEYVFWVFLVIYKVCCSICSEMGVYGEVDSGIVGVEEVMWERSNFCCIFDIGSYFVLFVLGWFYCCFY